MKPAEIALHTPDGVLRLPVPSGRAVPLSRLIWLEAERFLAPGQQAPAAPPLCAGLGRCGACRARFISAPPEAVEVERDVLTERELADGWRLLCRHEARAGMEIELPHAAGARPPAETPLPRLCAPGQEIPVRLAVDFGTTSVAWQVLSAAPNGMLDAAPGDVLTDSPDESPGASARLPAAFTVAPLAFGQFPNPQAGAGSDVISRIRAASDSPGAELLRHKGLAGLAAIVSRIEAAGGRLTELCLAANPAMTAILLGHSVSGLAAAPYKLDYAGGALEMLELAPGRVVPAYIPPQVAPFVGGDATAGMAWIFYGPPGEADSTQMHFPFVLADLGTNGELIVHGPSGSLAASVALGPALEGIGLACGGGAVPGAVRDVQLHPGGLRLEVIGGGEATHLCATGYFSLLRSLRNIGLLTADGHFAEPATPLACKLAAQVRDTPHERRFHLTERIFCGSRDIEELLKAKAAFSLGLELLLEHAGLAASDLGVLYLAGALGEHANAADLAALGFIPTVLERRCRAIGNSSLAGAARLLQNPAERKRLERWASACREVPLAEDPEFARRFFDHMRFS